MAEPEGRPSGERVREPSPAAAGDLPDVNVWLALVHGGHPHHRSARRWWAARSGPVWFCRVTMLGLVRLLAQPRVMGEHAMGAADAMQVYAQLSDWPEVGLCLEPAGCEASYREWVTPELPARLLTDAYLAAFAHAAGLRLVTFDRDFARFGGLHRLELS